MKRLRHVLLPVMLFLGLLATEGRVFAGEELRIREGVYADTVSLGGLTKEEAVNAVEQYVTKLIEGTITLLCVGNQSLEVNVKDLKVYWDNPEIIDQALAFGNQGNVIVRYKALKDLLKEPKVFSVHLSADVSALREFLEITCGGYDKPAVDASLRRENGQFFVDEGQNGYFLDADASAKALAGYFSNGYDGLQDTFSLQYITEMPREDGRNLALVKDVLGEYKTSFAGSSQARCSNIKNGCSLINGTTLYPGDEFSVYDAVAPFTTENGYRMAGSFLEGHVVDSLGGGICQVSTTLYNAILQSELEVVERHSHSMVVSYVGLSRDAAISESAGKDLRFVNNTEYPLYIEGITQENTISFRIYGVEMRLANRTISFETETVKKIPPGNETVVGDAGRSLGEMETEGAVTGYQTKLWKVIRENGKEKRREFVNESYYKMRPKTTIVGTATSDSGLREEMNNAIKSGNISQIRSVLEGQNQTQNGN